MALQFLIQFFSEPTTCTGPCTFPDTLKAGAIDKTVFIPVTGDVSCLLHCLYIPDLVNLVCVYQMLHSTLSAFSRSFYENGVAILSLIHTSFVIFKKSRVLTMPL